MEGRSFSWLGMEGNFQLSIINFQLLCGCGGSGCRLCGGCGFGFAHLAAVNPKLRGPAEFSELVTHHLFRDVHGGKLFTVVDGEGEPYELGWNVAVPGPRLEDLLLLIRSHSHDLL